MHILPYSYIFPKTQSMYEGPQRQQLGRASVRICTAPRPGSPQMHDAHSKSKAMSSSLDQHRHRNLEQPSKQRTGRYRTRLAASTFFLFFFFDNGLLLVLLLAGRISRTRTTVFCAVDVDGSLCVRGCMRPAQCMRATSSTCTHF